MKKIVKNSDNLILKFAYGREEKECWKGDGAEGRFMFKMGKA